MMDASRHKSVDTLRGYVRDADAFRDHAAAELLWNSGDGAAPHEEGKPHTHASHEAAAIGGR
jgi:hypothetical protein